jgi:hypothetical protein
VEDKAEVQVLVAQVDQHILVLFKILLQVIQQQLRLVLAVEEKVLLVIF